MATTLEFPLPNETSAAEQGSSLKSRLTENLMAQRTPGQIIRITQVSQHHFRVNFLSPSTIQGQESTLRMYRITKSQFLHVLDQNGELVITDQTRH